MSVVSFTQIHAVACERKGGEEALKRLIPEPADHSLLPTVGDDRVLSMMARCVFRAGLPWHVIDDTWDAFEDVFLGFDPARLCRQDAGFWEDLERNPQIVRNGPKIRSVRVNADYVLAVARARGSFGTFLSQWPDDDQVGLMADLDKRGSRLGPSTAQYFLRFIGWDGFVLSPDVVGALKRFGIGVGKPSPTKRDLARIQRHFNDWRAQSGWSASRISKLLALCHDSRATGTKRLG